MCLFKDVRILVLTLYFMNDFTISSENSIRMDPFEKYIFGCNLCMCYFKRGEKIFCVNKSSLHHGKRGHGVVHFQTRQLFFVLSRLCDTNDNNYRVSRNNQSQILRSFVEHKCRKVGGR